MPRPRPAKFRVLPLVPPEGEYKWRLDGYFGGRRVQKKFKSEKEARKEAKRNDQENDQYKEISLTAEDHVSTLNLKGHLKNTGKTYADVIAYVKRFAKLQSVRFSEFAERFLSELKRNPRSLDFPKYNQITKDQLVYVLRKLNDTFKEQCVADITQDDIRKWLKSLRKKDGSLPRTSTINNMRGHSFSVFKVAVLWKYTDVSPMRGIAEFEKTEEEEIEDNLKDHEKILSPDSVERLLHAAAKFDPTLIPYIAIPVFTGLRKETLKKLDWSDVQLSNGQMYIPDFKGKNHKPYPVPLTDNLVKWLKPFEQESGSLLGLSYGPGSFGQPSGPSSRKRLRYLACGVSVKLAFNTFRDTFISMDVKLHGNIYETATKTNTSVEIIRKHYLGKVKNLEDAVRYFKILPNLDLAKRLRQSTVPPQFLHCLPYHEESGKFTSSKQKGVKPQPPPYRAHARAGRTGVLG